MSDAAMTWDDASARADAAVARSALDAHGFSDRRTAELINLSENATFLVTDPESDRRAVLRVHRIGYHDLPAIESELDWLAAVRDQAGVSTPVVIPTAGGDRVVTTRVHGIGRHAVLFELVPGTRPHDGKLVNADFEVLGAITARLHRHSRSWQRPAGFTRFAWDWEHAFGDSPRWGHWRDGINVGAAEEGVLDAAADLVRNRLGDYGTSAERFGLVHADLRLANLLIDGDRVNVIDFDDCGFSWFMYDFGAAVSFIEHDPRLAEWQAAWIDGYESVARLSGDDKDMLATFVMLRRLLLLAWMGSHSHSQESQQIGPAYTAGSCELAERYLASNGRRLF